MKPQVYVGDGMVAKFCKEGEECFYSYCICRYDGEIPLRKATEEETKGFWFMIGQEAGAAASKY